MPRVSNEEKQRNHNKIVDAAARLFRENGIEMTSVADVMKAAGLTHGGFYRHFGSKEDLISAALDRAVDDVLKEGEEAPEGQRAHWRGTPTSHGIFRKIICQGVAKDVRWRPWERNSSG
jgi:AcrR family transcriptional regulator